MDISAGEIEGSKFREGKVMIKEIPGASVNKKKNQNSRFTFLLTACPFPFPLPPNSTQDYHHRPACQPSSS